jgi:hypothetical protein
VIVNVVFIGTTLYLTRYRLRKALTTQLHTLRQELGPKEESLMRVTEKLTETDREYELSLQAIAEKERNLNQKSENLNLLQKQVRELRYAAARKEKVLRRAAILLDEYKFSLEQAYFKVEKRTVYGQHHPSGTAAAGAAPGTHLLGAGDGTLGVDSHGHGHARKHSVDKIVGSTAALAAAAAANAANNTGEVVEIIAQNEGMKAAMKRLSGILTPFLNEETTDVCANLFFF